jgi:hypothetical protein
MGRRDVPQYALDAVFEAITNAVAHRDYSIYGSKVRLRMFSDRLELYSPGALPNTLDLDSLPYRQISRNDTITSLLARCPVADVEWLKTSRTTIMDRRGEGVPLSAIGSSVGTASCLRALRGRAEADDLRSRPGEGARRFLTIIPGRHSTLR